MRRAYAKQILAVMDVRDPRVEAAFARGAPRSLPGRRSVADPAVGRRTVTSPSDDPVYLYTDDLVAIDAGAQAQQWAAVVPCLSDGLRGAEAWRTRGPCRGRRRLLQARSWGISSDRAGRVTAIEYEADLAARGPAPTWHPTTASNSSKATGPWPRSRPADVIYVNAGNDTARRPVAGQAEGGRRPPDPAP